MNRCKGITQKGSKCRNRASDDSSYCYLHQEQKKSGGLLLSVGLGSIIGNALAPGIGGVLLGGLGGAVINNLSNSSTSKRKTRVFISFDFDNDKALKHFIVAQSNLPNSPFELVDLSLKEAAPEKQWVEKARISIKKSDLVLVLVGQETYRASGVLKEVKIAREEGISIVQMIGYKDRTYTPVPDAGRLYSWNWKNLKKLLS